jgi:hypothetical protein
MLPKSTVTCSFCRMANPPPPAIIIGPTATL